MNSAETETGTETETETETGTEVGTGVGGGEVEEVTGDGLTPVAEVTHIQGQLTFTYNYIVETNP